MALLISNSHPHGQRNHFSPRLKIFCLVLGWLAVLAPTPARSEGAESLKAAYAYRFTKYVDWPTNLFATAGAPVLIGVHGDAPMADLIEKVVGGGGGAGPGVVVRRCLKVEELAGCHVVFLRATERARQLDLLNALRGRPVLTVCDSEAFFNQGIAIRLVNRPDGTVGFWVNRLMVEQAGLKLRSGLLKVADKVLDQAPVSNR